MRSAGVGQAGLFCGRTVFGKTVIETAVGAALALSLLAAGCVDIVDGNKVLSEESRPVSGFERVTARGGLDVTIEEGDFSVLVRIDENLQPYVETSVDDGTLTIAVDDANIRKKLPGPHVLITMPSLSDAETAGEGTLTATAFEADAPVSLEMTGTGKLIWSGRATDLDVVLAGSGDISLEGTAEAAEFSLRGAGTLDARDLVADSARIELDGPGALSVTVNGRVDARAANGGSVDLFGRVVEGEIDSTAGATITAH